MKTLKVTSASSKCIIQALQYMISSFPESVKGYNQSRPFRKALNEIRRNDDRQNKHSRTS